MGRYGENETDLTEELEVVTGMRKMPDGRLVITDSSTIQFRMLNLSKGPAMWSPRSQCDRMKFSACWRDILEHTEGLDMFQDDVVELLVEENRVAGVRTALGVSFSCSACGSDQRDFFERAVACRAGEF